MHDAPHAGDVVLLFFLLLLLVRPHRAEKIFEVRRHGISMLYSFLLQERRVLVNLVFRSRQRLVDLLDHLTNCLVRMFW